MLEAIGFRFLRRSKGDHTIYVRENIKVVIAGGDNREMKKGAWEILRKRLGLGE